MTSHEGRVCAETQMHAGGLCIVTQSRTWKAAATSQRNSSLQAEIVTNNQFRDDQNRHLCTPRMQHLNL